VQGLDRAVRLSAAGADQRMPDAELGERLTEVAGAKLATVVAEHSFQPRASAGPRATLSLCARGSTHKRNGPYVIHSHRGIRELQEIKLIGEPGHVRGPRDVYLDGLDGRTKLSVDEWRQIVPRGLIGH
jgi:hypothetical protein